MFVEELSTQYAREHELQDRLKEWLEEWHGHL